MELGQLKKIEARQLWKNEARNFTPWLADNIDELGNAVGIDLEIENTEVSVGPYSADILAKDTGADRYVVIENQIEKTNHDHLGKSITYASALNASTVIWIATDFTEEHKKALDWLNDCTTDDVSFYGVQVEIWKIDDNREAVRFNVICKPNETFRAVRTNTKSELSDTKKFQQGFWSRLREKLFKSKKFPSLQSPRPQNWYDISLGKSGIHLQDFYNTSDKFVGIRVYICGKIVNDMLPYLTSKKEEIETAIGQKLQWDPTPKKKDRVIALNYPIDPSKEEEEEKALDWLVEYTIKFREVFLKHIHNKP